jgi:hypothetical protein
MNKDEVETDPDSAYFLVLAGVTAERERIFNALRDLSSGGIVNQPLFLIEKAINNK